MNFGLSQIPERTNKPRQKGMTMVMDKGLSIEEVKRFLSSSGSYVDVVKLGFGTAYVTPNLKEKLEVYRSHDVPIYFGGTLFEAFVIRNQLDDYIGICKEFNVDYTKVYEKKKEIKKGSESIWKYSETLINESVEKGILIKK